MGVRLSLLALPLLGAFSFLSAGCALAPAYHAPSLEANSPARWHLQDSQTEEPTKDLLSWWSRFEDPVLAKLQAQAQKESPTVGLAVARIRQSRAAVTQAGGSISGGVGAAVTQVGGDSSRTSQSASLDLSWELDVFGGKAKAVDAANARAQASVLNWHQARVSLAAEVASGYFSWKSCSADLQIYTEIVASRKKSLELTKLQVDAGMQAPLTVDQAFAALAESSSLLESKRASCVQAKNKLAMLTVVPQETLSEELAKAPDGFMYPPLLVSSVPAHVLSQRPDVAAAERILFAASSDIGVAKASFLPSVSLAGVISFNATAGGSSTNTWSFGPTLRLPVVSPSLLNAAMEVVGGRYDEAYQSWRQTVLGAVREVEDALSRAHTSGVRLTAAEAAVMSQLSYLKAMQARFDAGVVSALDVEDAHRLVLAAKQSLLIIQAEKIQAVIGVYKAAGGGWNS